MRERWLGLVALVGGVVALGGCNAGQNRWSALSSGRPTKSILVAPASGGRVEVSAFQTTDDKPGVAYRTPAGQGGSLLAAVGDGGWAVEPWAVKVGDHVLVYGASIPQTARVVWTTVNGSTMSVAPKDVGLPMRFFAAFLPADQAPETIQGLDLGGKKANDLRALDQAGVLLGRTHYNVNASRPPCSGPWDGSFDRTHGPPVPEPGCKTG